MVKYIGPVARWSTSCFNLQVFYYIGEACKYVNSSRLIEYEKMLYDIQQ